MFKKYIININSIISAMFRRKIEDDGYNMIIIFEIYNYENALGLKLF